MRCPYTDIGCYYIDDESHNCDADNRNIVCPHEPKNREKKEKKEAPEE
jgi:hypothetical protein